MGAESGTVDIIDLLSEEDKAAIVASLQAWQADGVANPLIPMNVDVDGDGIADSFGLDDNGNLIVVTSAPLKDTVFESAGGGVETDRTGEDHG